VKLLVREAVEADAHRIAELRVAAAKNLTGRFGEGFWSSTATDRGVISGIKRGKVFVAADHGEIVGTLTLSARRPASIDVSYFTPARQPIYLTSMAVDPAHQGKGVGRFMLEAAVDLVKAWPGRAIRLDAFDAEAGAGGFYAKCGYRMTGRAVFRGVPLIYYELLL
jgi:GNAT superfamily N-acetyltransferase